jgi:para-nitrobenzyl esterase
MRAAFLCVFSIFLVGCERQPSVAVDGQLLVGKTVDEVAIFLGVPFAEPPVGDLRWRAPQPLESKLERRDVTEFAPACMQTMRILDWYRSLAETFGASGDYYDDLEISEDCLYLNLWTPTLDNGAKLPVMVWVHGGSNKSGWSYEPNYHGHELAKKDVVVVSVAYRHGAFGFLSHPELGLNDAVANFGLWDIVASLHWVQENIARFGGDPGRVTLFGESSGAENILALMFAAQADGLFHRAILESTAGYGIDSSPLIAEQARGTRLASILGFTGDDALALLKQTPADELLRVYENTFADYYHSPVIDGQLLTESTWENIQAGRFSGHQLIVGTNADESPDRQSTAEDYLCPSQETAASMTASGGNAWMYFFTRVRDDAGGQKVGAFHGAEYSYAFGVHDAYMRTTDIDISLTSAMMSYWTQFAATGNPNSAATPNWPGFRAPHFEVQDLGREVATIPAPEPELCALFRAANDGRN